jgi:hypothetical protein
MGLTQRQRHVTEVSERLVLSKRELRQKLQSLAARSDSRNVLWTQEAAVKLRRAVRRPSASFCRPGDMQLRGGLWSMLGIRAMMEAAVGDGSDALQGQAVGVAGSVALEQPVTLEARIRQTCDRGQEFSGLPMRSATFGSGQPNTMSGLSAFLHRSLLARRFRTPGPAAGATGPLSRSTSRIPRSPLRSSGSVNTASKDPPPSIRTETAGG